MAPIGIQNAMNDKAVLLHGLGETSAAWHDVISHLNHVEVTTPDLFTPALLRAGWSLEKATDVVADILTEPVHVVGVSLGAVVGLDLATRYPQLVKSLFLLAPQVKPSRTLMWVQRKMMRILPSSLVCPPGITKADLLAVLDTLRDLDIEPGLANINVPTGIVCGSCDWANRKVARIIAEQIPGATCVIVEGAGHQWHVTHPDNFAGFVGDHWSCC